MAWGGLMGIGLMMFASVLMTVLMFMSIILKRNRKVKIVKILVLSAAFGLISFGFLYLINTLLMQAIDAGVNTLNKRR